MKIFAAGLFTETNTFSPIPTGLDDFETIRGADPKFEESDLYKLPPFGQWYKKAKDRNDSFVFGLFAGAQPAGLTSKSCYEKLRDELLETLKQVQPVDVVLLNLHGAMVAHGYDDCEGDLIDKIRHQVGPGVVIAVELDLHCHLTEKMLQQADLIITYKEYPHVDIAARGDELFDLALGIHKGQYKPVMVAFDCKMVGLYPTTTATMREFLDSMVAVEKLDRVMSVSFIHGFKYGDVAEAGSKLLVITNSDMPLAELKARELGQKIFSKRDCLSMKSLVLDEALNKAFSLGRAPSTNSRPVVVADQSDNAGGGAPSDSTFALKWLFEHDIENVAMAIFYDPQVVKFALSAGVGASLKVRLGGKLAASSGDPLDLDVDVKAIQRDYYHQFPQGKDKSIAIYIGDTVALSCRGIDIIVSSERSQCFSPCIFRDLGINVSAADILVVKSTQHFYDGFAPIAKEIIYMAGPGAVPPLAKKIPYKKMTTDDKYPWCEDPFQ